MEKLKAKLDNLCAICGSEMKPAPGIGPYCPKKKCLNSDGPSVWMVLDHLFDGKIDEKYSQAARELSGFNVSLISTKLKDEK